MRQEPKRGQGGKGAGRGEVSHWWSAEGEPSGERGRGAIGERGEGSSGSGGREPSAKEPSGGAGKEPSGGV